MGHHRPIQWCFLELFVIFCVQKKEKKTVPKWLEWMYFCLCIWKWSDTEVWTGTSSVLEKTGKLVCLVAFCVFFFFVFLSLFFFSFFFTFLLSLLHHDKTFSTNIHMKPVVRKSSCRCNDEAKPFMCTALCWMAEASVRPADMVLLFSPSLPPLVNLLSFNCT